MKMPQYLRDAQAARRTAEIKSGTRSDARYVGKCIPDKRRAKMRKAARNEMRGADSNESGPFLEPSTMWWWLETKERQQPREATMDAYKIAGMLMYIGGLLGAFLLLRRMDRRAKARVVQPASARYADCRDVYQHFSAEHLEAQYAAIVQILACEQDLEKMILLKEERSALRDLLQQPSELPPPTATPNGRYPDC